MARVEVSEADLLAALRQASADAEDDGALTVVELAAAAGLSVPMMRERVRALKVAGRIECVPVYREALDGRSARVPGYRLTERAA